MSLKEKTTAIDLSGHNISGTSRKLKRVKTGTDTAHQEEELLNSSPNDSRGKYAELSPIKSKSIMAVVPTKQSTRRKKATSNAKQKASLGNTFGSAARNIIYSSPVTRVPSTRSSDSKASLAGKASAKNVTKVVHKIMARPLPGTENIDPQTSFRELSKLKLENSTNVRQSSRTVQNYPVVLQNHASLPARTTRSTNLAANHDNENDPAMDESITPIDAAKIKGRYEPNSDVLLKVARMRSRAKTDGGKHEDSLKMIPARPTEIPPVKPFSKRHSNEIVGVDKSLTDTSRKSQNQVGTARSIQKSLPDHMNDESIDRDNEVNDNPTEEEQDDFQKISANWRSQNTEISPLKIENDSFLCAVPAPLKNNDLRNDDLVESSAEYTQSENEHDTRITDFRQPLDIEMSQSNHKSRGRQYKQVPCKGSIESDFRSKDDEESFQKEKYRVNRSGDESDGEPSSDEDGVIAM